jgi:hypothetical protein
VSLLALSRTCALSDFPDCRTVASWQQQLAERAWACWVAEQHVLTRGASLVVNYSDIPFTAPGPTAIYQYRGDGEVLVDHALPAIYALCVLDRIEAPVRFLVRAAQILRPQGLLFCSFAFWDAQGPDVAAGADGRRRIYDVQSWKKLVAEARKAGFRGFGGHDWHYHGNTLEDHSLASLVLTRR